MLIALLLVCSCLVYSVLGCSFLLVVRGQPEFTPLCSSAASEVYNRHKLRGHLWLPGPGFSGVASTPPWAHEPVLVLVSRLLLVR